MLKIYSNYRKPTFFTPSGSYELTDTKIHSICHTLYKFQSLSSLLFFLSIVILLYISQVGQWYATKLIWEEKEKAWFVAFDYFYCVNATTITDFKLPARQYWTQNWEDLYIISSYKLVWPGSRTPWRGRSRTWNCEDMDRLGEAFIHWFKDVLSSYTVTGVLLSACGGRWK